MSVTVRIKGSLEDSRSFERFPTEEQLRKLGFPGRYRSSGKFWEKLDSVMRKTGQNRTNEIGPGITSGEIVYIAVLRKGIPVIDVK